MILDCIYQSTFSDWSHSYRPNRSIHSAVAPVENWNSSTWLIKGDISACFDEVDHRVLESILRERISDERFIRLINKLLRAGYLDTDLSFNGNKAGDGQGAICSPILANVYLDKLDRFMEDLVIRETKGKYRKQNPDEAKFLGFRITKLKSYIRILMDTDKLVHKLKENGMCNEYGYPIAMTKIQNKPIQDIIKYANEVLRGLLHNNQDFHNFWQASRIQYIVQFSTAKIIARKFDRSMKSVFQDYGYRLTTEYRNLKGELKETSLAMFRSFKRNKDFLKNWIFKLKEHVIVSYDTRNPLVYCSC